MCRKSLCLCVIAGVLFAVLCGCPSSSKNVKKSDKTVSTSSQEESGKNPDGTSPGTQKTAIPVTYYVHTVKWPGETVSIIAGWYTGDIQNWKILAEANPGIDPQAVVAGLKIYIPANIITKRDPMTKAYVDSFYHKEKKIRPRSAPAAKKDEEPILYGPK